MPAAVAVTRGGRTYGSKMEIAGVKVRESTVPTQLFVSQERASSVPPRHREMNQTCTSNYSPDRGLRRGAMGRDAFSLVPWRWRERGITWTRVRIEPST
ncbi:unnamed protein product [Boreogadus saida]